MGQGYLLPTQITKLGSDIDHELLLSFTHNHVMCTLSISHNNINALYSQFQTFKGRQGNDRNNYAIHYTEKLLSASQQSPEYYYRGIEYQKGSQA